MAKNLSLHLGQIMLKFLYGNKNKGAVGRAYAPKKL